MIPAADREARRALEVEVGSPPALWQKLKERVQHENLKRLSDVSTDFLSILWCLDRYKSSEINPAAMAKDLSGSYRMKGNWFAELLTLLLENQTNSPLAPRSNVQGFSQPHQIDIAWPAGKPAPLVCLATKVMGGPGSGATRARASTADWTNRRKELKFQATDLKLFRRQQATRIDHWGNWRLSAPPSVYFVWCARLEQSRDDMVRMTRELRALNETYLDGSAMVAYRVNASETAYELVPISWADRAVDADDLIHRIASQINLLAARGDSERDVEPAVTRVDLSRISADVGIEDQ